MCTASQPVSMDEVKNKYRYYVIGVILGILVVQSYWFVGTTTLKDIESYERQTFELNDEIGKLETIADENISAAEKLAKPLVEKRESIRLKYESAGSAIDTWNAMWDWLFVWVDKKDVGAEAGSGNVRSASAVVSILGLYVLPLLYGWIGAMLRGLRRMMEDELTNAKLWRIQLSTSIGAVVGPIVGLFLSPDSIASLPAQTAPFALAFLAGYATDVFFNMLDRVAEAMKVPGSDAGPTTPNRTVNDLELEAQRDANQASGDGNKTGAEAAAANDAANKTPLVDKTVDGR